MKILHVSYGGLGNGGVTSVIISIVSTLYRKFDFGCVVFSRRCEREADFLKYGKLHRLNCYCSGNVVVRLIEQILRPFVMTVGVYRICKKEHYDVVHCHNGRDMLFPLLAAKVASVPRRIAHCHNTRSTEKRGLFIWIYDHLLWFVVNRLATDFVGCSKKACEDYFKGKKSQVIYNSIDLSRFSWNQKRNDQMMFVHVGRFDYQKNQEFVINVFDSLKENFPHSILRLVGFGRNENALRQIVAFKGLADRVLFVDGHNADVPKILSESDCMIFPSYFEGFGIVLLEAQASGCYCFASDVCPSDVNVGLMEQLPLAIGVNGWREKILIHFEKEINNDVECVVSQNLKKFGVDSICKRYCSLYAVQ